MFTVHARGPVPEGGGITERDSADLGTFTEANTISVETIAKVLKPISIPRFLELRNAATILGIQ